MLNERARHPCPISNTAIYKNFRKKNDIDDDDGVSHFVDIAKSPELDKMTRKIQDLYYMNKLACMFLMSIYGGDTIICKSTKVREFEEKDDYVLKDIERKKKKAADQQTETDGA